MTPILFVINPISGGKSKSTVVDAISAHLDLNKFEAEIHWWEDEHELEEKIEAWKTKENAIVVAVGGDGTINRIMSLISNSDLRMGIIAMGSGNGLARELQIPLDPLRALERINQNKPGTAVDAGFINGKLFSNVCGLGFDAEVSERFSHSKSRGLMNYVKAVIRQLRITSSQSYVVECENEVWEGEYMMISIANGKQWGNDFKVAANADISDGLLDMVMIKRPKLWQIPGMLKALQQGREYKGLIRYLRSDNFLIKRQEGPVHVDGEPLKMGEELQLEIKQHYTIVV